jgi:hypothetical protein
MVSVAWEKRALPLYWKLLEGNGASNLREQQAVICPLIKQLKKISSSDNWRCLNFIVSN